jgi:hypothetical protein
MSQDHKIYFFYEVKEFVSLQVNLLHECLGGMKFDIFSKIPKMIHVEGEPWLCKKHGGGIEFRGVLTHRIVDVHTSVNKPLVFDAWRLEIYFRSLGKRGIKILKSETGFISASVEIMVIEMLRRLLERGLIKEKEGEFEIDCDSR